MKSALSARFARFRPLFLVLPLVVVIAGCGNSISPTNPVNTTAVSIVLTATPTTIAGGTGGTAGITVLSATVTNASGTAFVAPSGSVTFTGNSGVTLGTATLKPNPDNISATAVLQELGSSLAVGPNIITATTLADSFHSAGTSNAVTVTVTGGTGGATATTTTLTPPTATISANQSATLTATVTATSGALAPTGQIEFLDQTTGSSVATPFLNASGTVTATATASIPAGSFGIGKNNVVAIYEPSGSNAFGTSTSSVSVVTVNSGSGGSTATTATIAANPTTITAGGTTTLTAMISSASTTAYPGGTVTFYDQTDMTSLGSSPVSNGSNIGTGTASLSASASLMASGTNLIVAQYAGDSTFSATDSASVTVTVNGTGGNGSATTTSVTPASLTLAYGGACGNISIIVAGAASGGAQTPTGNVDLTVDGEPLGNPNLGGYNGTSNTGYTLCPDNGTPLGAAGSYTLLVAYPGDANYAASSSTIPVTVSGTAKAQTTSELSVTSASTVPLGACGSVSTAVVISAEPNDAPPTGTVTFFVDGTTQIGKSAVSTTNTNSSASLNFCTGGTNAISAKGNYTITSTYGGDNNYNASNSNGTPFIVN